MKTRNNNVKPQFFLINETKPQTFLIKMYLNVNIDRTINNFKTSISVLLYSLCACVVSLLSPT